MKIIEKKIPRKNVFMCSVHLQLETLTCSGWLFAFARLCVGLRVTLSVSLCVSLSVSLCVSVFWFFIFHYLKVLIFTYLCV